MFYKQQSYLSQIVSKKAKTTILFFMKNSRNNNIILGFRFQFYVFGFSLSNEQNNNFKFSLSQQRLLTAPSENSSGSRNTRPKHVLSNKCEE